MIKYSRIIKSSWKVLICQLLRSNFSVGKRRGHVDRHLAKFSDSFTWLTLFPQQSVIDVLTCGSFNPRDRRLDANAAFNRLTIRCNEWLSHQIYNATLIWIVKLSIKLYIFISMILSEDFNFYFLSCVFESRINLILIMLIIN